MPFGISGSPWSLTNSTKARMLVSDPEGVRGTVAPVEAVTASRTRPSRGRPGTPSAGAKADGSGVAAVPVGGGGVWGPAVRRCVTAIEGEGGS
jgi:hypothetical protein